VALSILHPWRERKKRRERRGRMGNKRFGIRFKSILQMFHDPSSESYYFPLSLSLPPSPSTIATKQSHFSARKRVLQQY
jgi:hypothetical protein